VTNDRPEVPSATFLLANPVYLKNLIQALVRLAAGDSLKMNVVALVSGGKDSCYAMMKCMEYGHQVYSLSLVSPLFCSRENPGKVNKRNIWVVCM
jgi:hypothetical protein